MTYSMHCVQSKQGSGNNNCCCQLNHLTFLGLFVIANFKLSTLHPLSLLPLPVTVVGWQLDLESADLRCLPEEKNSIHEVFSGNTITVAADIFVVIVWGVKLYSLTHSH